MNLFDRKILDIYGLVHYMTPSSQHGYINACGVKRFEFPAKAFPISTYTLYYPTRGGKSMT